MLGCVPLAKMVYRSVNTLVFLDPWLTKEGPVTFPACALYQLLVRSCDLAHHGPIFVHMSVLAHITACFCISLWCVPSSLSVLRWKSTRMCGRLLAPLSGITLTTRAIHSLHYTVSNSYKMVRAPRLCSYWPPHTRLTTTSSGSVSSPQLPHSAISSQVPAGPTRNVTGEAMPTSLAEAVSQLLFLEFLQRCNLLIVPPQPPQLPVPISPLDAAVQTLPHSAASAVSRNVSTQLSFREVLAPPSTHDVPCSGVLDQSPRFLLMWLCRRLYTASWLMMSPHYLSRSSSLGASFPTTL